MNVTPIVPRAEMLLVVAIAVMAAMLSAGCKAIYYYETERFGFTIEGKPDATEPVTGELGFKQRVALVLPGSRDTSAPQEIKTLLEETSDESLKGSTTTNAATVTAANREAGEAVSVISYYRLKKTPNPNGAFAGDPTEIYTSFITGPAAVALTPSQQSAAQRALVADIPSDLAIATQIWRNIAESSVASRTAFEALVAKVPDSLSEAEREAFFNISNVRYRVSLHQSLKDPASRR